ncbi:MAG: hypothetical protein NTX53_01005, partial [candidate division WOR-3 bacterium]|nr:hypothetical protein [candidate division WOR-3 bacterium]
WDVTTPTSPYRLGFLARADHAFAVAVSGNYAFVADRDSGLRVISVADPGNPYQVSRLDTPGDAVDVAVQGQYAYVADSVSVRVVDISAPASPREVGHCDSTRARGIVVSGQYAYVAGSGLQVVNVADPAHPYKMGFCPTPSSAVDVALAGSYAYVSDNSFGMIIVDITNPQAPTRVGSMLYIGDYSVKVSGTQAYVIGFTMDILDVADPRNPAVLGEFLGPDNIYGGVAVSGDYAYVTDGYKGIRVIDISDPTATREVARCDTIGGTTAVLVDGQYAYTGNGVGGIDVIDVSVPDEPSVLGHCGTGGALIECMALQDSILCVAGQMDVPIVDVSDPVHPRRVGTFEDPIFPRGVAIQGRCLYVADAYDSGGLRTADISDPSTPRELSLLPVPGRAYDVAVSPGRAYVAVGDSGLAVIDVTDPSDPEIIGRCPTPGLAHGVALSWPYAYVACYSGGLRIVDISDPTNPREVGYHTRPGTAGNLAVQGSRVFTVDRGTNLNILENVLYGIDEAEPGQVAESPVRLLENPVRNGRLRLAIPPNAAGTATLSVFDVAGRNVAQYPALALWGRRWLDVPVGSLPSGGYILRVSTPGGNQHVRFVIVASARPGKKRGHSTK